MARRPPAVPTGCHADVPSARLPSNRLSVCLSGSLSTQLTVRSSIPLLNLSSGRPAVNRQAG